MMQIIYLFHKELVNNDIYLKYIKFLIMIVLKWIFWIIIIIIIKKGQQCNARREWYTPYQSEDPSPTIPTYRQKEEKGKESRRLY